MFGDPSSCICALPRQDAERERNLIEKRRRLSTLSAESDSVGLGTRAIPGSVAEREGLRVKIRAAWPELRTGSFQAVRAKRDESRRCLSPDSAGLRRWSEVEERRFNFVECTQRLIQSPPRVRLRKRAPHIHTRQGGHMCERDAVRASLSGRVYATCECTL